MGTEQFWASMQSNAIFPNATVEKLEGTDLIGPWCSVEAKPLDVTVEIQSFGQLLNARLGDPTLELWATQRDGVVVACSRRTLVLLVC